MLLVAAVMWLSGCAPRQKGMTGASGDHGSATEWKPVWRDIGTSVEGRPIRAATYENGPGCARVLIFAGIHGDEWQGVDIAQRFLDVVRRWDRTRVKVVLAVIPIANPDGVFRRRRTNAHGVDLNRNFPASNWTQRRPSSAFFGGTEPAGEPETQAMIAWVEGFRPDRILSLHVMNNSSYCNNYDGPAGPLAQAMAHRNGYRVKADIGYPTPGSFGTWAGRERAIPTVTLELPAHTDIEHLWEVNREALTAFVRGTLE